MDTAGPLTPTQSAQLLAVARRAIRDRVQRCPASAPPVADPVLQAPGAAFVTLTSGGSLRGCIGYVQALRPLVDAVAHAAASAATADPRFPSVTPAELADVCVEISVLSTLQPVADPSEVRVGVHGLHVSKDGRRGLLLPQVAVEFGWDRDTFLNQACIKAGLPSDAWRHGAEIEIFTVQRIADGLPMGAIPA